VERLSEAAALSRSVLHERFVHFIGQAPMQYRVAAVEPQSPERPCPGRCRGAGALGKRQRDRGSTG